MKKYLLFGSALLVAISAYPQAGKLTRPIGVLETKLEKNDPAEPASQNASAFIGPVRQVKRSINSGSKVAAAALNFTGSMNVLGYLVSQQKPLQYNKGVNAVSLIARKSTTYTANSNSNSGTIVGLYSTNLGASWDETCIWSNASDLARYPQGGIYNPLGNTNLNNAYLVGTGPFTSSAGGWGGPTNGAWYCSKQITTPGNTTSGPDQQSSYYQGGFLKPHYMSRYSFAAIDGGLVRSMANIINDPAGATNLAFGLRGALLVRGAFSAGAFVWGVDSFIPPVRVRSDASPLIGTASPIAAWNDAGTIGYVIILGSRNGVSPEMSGYQPIVYKTTNSGASWSLLPAYDFTCEFRAISDRLYATNANTNVICPNMAGSEGFDAAVDVNGQLHFVSMVRHHTSTHVDTMDYRSVFGTEQYDYALTGPLNYPVIYDFYTKASGGWDYHIVDSMGTVGPSGSSTGPGYGTNIWTSATAKYDLDARIQISRSDDGSKLFYSWAESDSGILSNKWNIYPDIKMKGFDVTGYKVTPRMNVSQTFTNVTQLAWWHYMSNKAAGLSSGCMTMPFTTCQNATYNGDAQVDTYYLDNVQVCAANFSVNPMSPKQSCILAVPTQETSAIEVLNFPNPANDATTIVVGLKTASNFEIVIYNSIGQTIDTYKVNGQVGANEINIDLSSFNSGIYFYNVKVGGSVITKKLVIQ